MTDYAEEKEILSTGNELEDAIVAIRNKQAQKTAEKLARERELAKVLNNQLLTPQITEQTEVELSTLLTSGWQIFKPRN